MKRILIASILALIVIGGITFAYFYYKELKMPQAEAINAIPASAAFILEFKNAKAFYDKFKSNKIWTDMQSNIYYKEIEGNCKHLDSLISKDADLKEFYCCQTIFVSVHYTQASNFDFLYITRLPSIKRESFIVDVIKKIAGKEIFVSKRTYQGIPINELKVPRSDKIFSWSVSKGVFIGSFSAILVEEAIRQIRIGKPFTDDKSFTKVYNSSGSITDANIFVNYKMFPKIASSFLKEDNSTSLNDLSTFTNWTEFDLKIKPEAFVLNGFTCSNDSTEFLKSFTNQKPHNTELINILPRRTAFLLYSGFSDFSSYYKALQTFLSTKGYKNNNSAKIKHIDSEYGISLKDKLISWMDNEFALFITESNSTSYSNNAFAVFRAKDIERAKASLHELNHAVSLKELNKVKEENYKGYTINYINLRGVLPLFFGPAFEVMDKLFYTTLGNYVVFGNQASSLRSLVDDFTGGKLLVKDAAYSNFSSNIPSSTNYYVYINLARSLQFLKGYFSEKLNDAIDNNMGLINKLNAIGIQFNNEGPLMYNTIYLQYNGVKKNDVNLLWSAQLDTSVSMSPQLVVNTEDKTNEIIIQDDSNQLYLIDNSGTIKWKSQLQEKIMGKIHQIDFYHNGKLQYLFNTASRLYLIDHNGDKVGNYPIRLPANSSCGMSVFDYENLREYRIFVPCENNIVYGYQGSGKPLGGWLFNRPIGHISRPVQYFNIDGKEYLLIADSKGSVYILDRKGKKKIEIKEKIFTSPNNAFELDSTDREPLHFVTTDTSGKLVYIYLDGKVKTRKVATVSSHHYFILKDINSDGKKDLIFLDKDNLFAMNEDTSAIFTHHFGKEVNTAPTVIILPNGKGKIGVTSDQTNELFLFNEDGTVYEGFPLKGSTSFTLGDFNNDRHTNIVVGSSDKMVYVYAIE